MTTASDLLLSVQDLSVSFELPTRTIHAVDGVSFELRSGETLGIVGESGCGKSTLARAVLRLIPHAGGRVLFQGQNLLDLSKKALRYQRQFLQMIFQDPLASLDPRMNVGQIIAEPLWTFQRDLGLSRRAIFNRVLEIIRSVGLLPEHVNRYPHEFSGGQCQRIGIARALALNPQIIICDEPVSALDVSIQAQIINLLMEIQEKNSLSLIFIAHNLNVVYHISHRVMVMYLGRVMEMGDVETVYRQPQHPYTRLLLDAVPVPDPTLQCMKKAQSPLAEVSLGSVSRSGCIFRTRCPLATSICAEMKPEWRQTEHGSWVACHHV